MKTKFYRHILFYCSMPYVDADVSRMLSKTVLNPDFAITRLGGRFSRLPKAAQEALRDCFLNRYPHKRVGFKLNDVKQLRWFQPFRWDMLRNREYDSPLKKFVVTMPESAKDSEQCYTNQIPKLKSALKENFKKKDHQCLETVMKKQVRDSMVNSGPQADTSTNKQPLNHKAKHERHRKEKGKKHVNPRNSACCIDRPERQELSGNANLTVNGDMSTSPLCNGVVIAKRQDFCNPANSHLQTDDHTGTYIENMHRDEHNFPVNLLPPENSYVHNMVNTMFNRDGQVQNNPVTVNGTVTTQENIEIQPPRQNPTSILPWINTMLYDKRNGVTTAATGGSIQPPEIEGRPSPPKPIQILKRHRKDTARQQAYVLPPPPPSMWVHHLAKCPLHAPKQTHTYNAQQNNAAIQNCQNSCGDQASRDIKHLLDLPPKPSKHHPPPPPSIRANQFHPADGPHLLEKTAQAQVQYQLLQRHPQEANTTAELNHRHDFHHCEMPKQQSDIYQENICKNNLSPIQNGPSEAPKQPTHNINYHDSVINPRHHHQAKTVNQTQNTYCPLVPLPTPQALFPYEGYCNAQFPHKNDPIIHQDRVFHEISPSTNNVVQLQNELNSDTNFPHHDSGNGDAASENLKEIPQLMEQPLEPPCESNVNSFEINSFISRMLRQAVLNENRRSRFMGMFRKNASQEAVQQQESSDINNQHGIVNSHHLTESEVQDMQNLFGNVPTETEGNRV